MKARTWIGVGCVLAGIGVVLGAFGAHALKERLTADQLANWQTAVSYQMWHGLALVLYGLFRSLVPGKTFPGWLFLVGSLFFSGSLYCLCLEVMKPVMGPVTPLGGTFLIAAWVSFAAQAFRRES